MISVLAELLEPSPAPSVGVTVTGLGAATSVFNVWRVAGGQRKLVQEGRNREAVGSDYLEDYVPPFNIPVSYEVEILSGPGVAEETFPGTITVESAVGWIQDPILPSSAIPVHGRIGDGSIILMAEALKALEYAADMNILHVMGQAEPVAQIGQRAIAGNVDWDVFTNAAEESNNLRELLMTAGILLVRPAGNWAINVPPLCYIAPGTVTESPWSHATGDGSAKWAINSPLVKAPSMDVLVPRWTWGDVEALWASATWGQVETAMAGKSWLDVTKNPAGT